MSFTTSKMLNSKVLVSGTDFNGVTGQTVIDSTQWDEVNSHRAYHTAEAEFEQAVENFFAPLTAAAEAMGKKLERPTKDSIDYVVLHDEVEGVKAEPAQIVKLDKSSIILRVIESGDTARLVWVNGELEILEVIVDVAAASTNVLASDADPA